MLPSVYVQVGLHHSSDEYGSLMPLNYWNNTSGFLSSYKMKMLLFERVSEKILKNKLFHLFFSSFRLICKKSQFRLCWKSDSTKLWKHWNWLFFWISSFWSLRTLNPEKRKNVACQLHKFLVVELKKITYVMVKLSIYSKVKSFLWVWERWIPRKSRNLSIFIVIWQCFDIHFNF